MDDAEPLVLKLGVALVVPLTACIISSLSFRAANGSSSNKLPTGDRRRLPATFVCGRGLKDALQVDQNGVALFSIIHGISAKTGITREKFPCCGKTQEIAEGLLSHESNQPFDPLCPPANAIECSDGEEEEEALLLPDVNLQQSNHEPAEALSAPEATVDGPLNAVPDKKEFEDEDEFSCLSSMFQSLLERDILLQIQMLEHHGRKEHEDAVGDLESRLRVSATEVEHLQAKAESLQKENEVLNLQVSQLSINMEELESEKAKAKHLKRRLKSERTQARATAGALEQRIVMLQEKLQKMEQDEAEARRNLERLRAAEAEIAELRMRNSALSRQNLELTRTLESAPTPCSREISQEANRPREASGRSEKITEQDADQFGDEEMIYLRWLGARLRYETKKHALLPWKAKCGSKSRSPESENTAAELASDDSASVCFDQKSIDKSHRKRDAGSQQKPKFFRKFKNILTRKSGGENNKVSPMTAADESVSACSIGVDRMASGFTVENSVRGAQCHEDDNWKSSSAWIHASYKSPRNVPKARMPGAEEDNKNKVSHCMSDLGASINFISRTTSGGDKLTDMASQQKIHGR